MAGCREAIEQIGYPAIIKPIAGAGSLDTYRIESDADLEAALPRLRHVDEVSVEEFIDGEEFTYDTVCSAGAISFYNIAEYRPRPLVGKQVEWISQQVIAHRDPDHPSLAGGKAMGEAVIAAMGFGSGFTHMEWYLTEAGEVVFGEIGARAPGARLTDLMNYSCDIDLFAGWAEAVCYGRFSQAVERRYNAAMVIKRAQGQGRITHIDGLAHLMATMGEHIVNIDLVAIGQPRRDWRATVLSDGIVVVETSSDPCLPANAPAVMSPGPAPSRIACPVSCAGCAPASTSAPDASMRPRARAAPSSSVVTARIASPRSMRSL